MHKLVVLLAVIAAVTGASTAQASAPTTTPVPGIDFVDTACGCPITIQVLSTETARTFSNGVTLVTGRLVWIASANGKTVTLHVSGPAKIVIASDGSATLFGFGVGVGDFMTANGPAVLEVAGPVVIPLDGSLPPVQGRVLLNLCDALA